MPRLSRAHWRVQTKEDGGWITREHPATLISAIETAERLATERQVDARVLLGTSWWYQTNVEALAGEGGRR